MLEWVLNERWRKKQMNNPTDEKVKIYIDRAVEQMYEVGLTNLSFKESVAARKEIIKIINDLVNSIFEVKDEETSD